MTRTAGFLLLAIAAASLGACETTRNERDDFGAPPEPKEKDDEKLLEIRSRSEDGVVLFTLHGDELREGGPDGRVLYVREGNEVHLGSRKGRQIYFVRENDLRQKNAKGEVLLHFFDHEIRRTDDPDSELLFVWRGTEVWRHDHNGPRVLHVDRGMPKWAVACALQGMY